MNAQSLSEVYEISATLASMIKDKRIEMKLSTRALAAMTGLSHSHISKYERGIQTNIGFENLLLITKALELDISILFDKDYL